jgi:hypothetical protein
MRGGKFLKNCPSGKICFPSRKKALQLSRRHSRRQSRLDIEVKLRIYHCPTCGAWHWASVKKKS